MMSGTFVRRVSLQNNFPHSFYKVVLGVVLFHVFIVGFFQLDVQFRSVSRTPDLEIELASSFQQSGNSDVTQIAGQAKQEKKRSLDRAVVPKNSSPEKDAVVIKSQEQESGAANSAAVGGGASNQIAGGLGSGADTQNPRLLSNVKPKYPGEAYRQRKEGTVILYVQVLETGAVGNVKVGFSSGVDLLDESAIEAVKEWKFSPGKASGKIVAQWIKVPITFNLKNR